MMYHKNKIFFQNEFLQTKKKLKQLKMTQKNEQSIFKTKKIYKRRQIHTHTHEILFIMWKK
jgi:hypothetical protein